MSSSTIDGGRLGTAAITVAVTTHPWCLDSSRAAGVP
jgi:hypothetical protein